MLKLKDRIHFLIPLFASLSLFPLQSCSNSQIGQQLANSFDSSPESIQLESNSKKVEPKKVEPKKVEPKKVEPKKVTKVRSVSVRQSRKTLSSESNVGERPNLEEIVIPFTPQPYRITIKLSGANPSAPAESVTKALRKAGVRFEVERIELVELSSSHKPSLVRRGPRL